VSDLTHGNAVSPEALESGLGKLVSEAKQPVAPIEDTVPFPKSQITPWKRSYSTQPFFGQRLASKFGNNHRGPLDSGPRVAQNDR